MTAASNAAKVATAKLATASHDAKHALLEELSEVIERIEREQSPAFQGLRKTKPDPAFPAQLGEAQMVTVPCDGLCLCHACIGAYHAREWREEHGEKGSCIAGKCSQQKAEEHQARCFLAHVLQLMHEYAQSDPARTHYHERASKIAAGAFPEDYDVPFYAACLNGCIECVPLGYSDSQEPSVIGAGPLRISVGNQQQVSDDGASVGHFILLQSWLPVEKDLQNRVAFPFGVRACCTLDDAPSIASPSSAAKPAVSVSPGTMPRAGSESEPSVSSSST